MIYFLIKNIICSYIILLACTAYAFNYKDIDFSGENIAINYKPGYSALIYKIYTKEKESYRLEKVYINFGSLKAYAKEGFLYEDSMKLFLYNDINLEIDDWNLSAQNISLDIKNFNLIDGVDLVIKRNNVVILAKNFIGNLSNKSLYLEGQVEANIKLSNF